MAKKKLITVAERKALRNELLKSRYKILRDLGFTSTEARKLRKQTKTLDFDTKNAYSKKTGKVKKTKKIKKVLEMSEGIKINNKFEEYKKKTANVTGDNDTVLSDWGYMTAAKIKKGDEKGKFYKNENLKMVKSIKKDMKLNNDQAFYMLWYMRKYKVNYLQAKEDMVSDEYFNIYATTKNYRLKPTAKIVNKLTKVKK